MPDLVVCVRKDFWNEWIAEGDAAGDPPTGDEWGYFMGGRRPNIGTGDRLYIVAHGMLRGYAPVTRLNRTDGFSLDERLALQNGHQWVICRGAGAVAVTIPEPIKGFQGWRYRFWERSIEIPFPDWKTKGVA